MKISLSTVRIKKIKPSKPKDSFSTTILDAATQIILDVEGLINPPILLRTGSESYKVIEGDFEYYAALQAMDIERKRNRINVYIVESEDELPFYQQQIKVFRHYTKTENQPADDGSTTINDNFQILQAIRKLSNQFKDGNVKIGQKLDKLHEKVLPSPPPKQKLDFLNDINTLPNEQIKLKLKNAGANTKIINGILSERKNSFKSMVDLIERSKSKRLGLQEKIFDMLDNWS